MRCHVTTKPSVFHGPREGFLDPSDRLAVPFDGVVLSTPLPPSKMGQKLRQKRYGRLPFLGLSLARWSAIEDPAIKVDPPSPAL